MVPCSHAAQFGQGVANGPRRNTPVLPLDPYLPARVKTDMGKPLFKAPDGGQFEILWEKEDLTQSELQRG